MNNKIKLMELLYDVPAYYGTTHDQKDLKSGIVVEVINEYIDDGFWSEDDGSMEHPYPAYKFRFDGLTYCSVHKNCFREI
jgi:hypothetical protein